MQQNNKYNILTRWGRSQQATAVAVLFHAIGLAGMLWGDQQFFAKLSAYNILLMFLLLFYTEQPISKTLFIFFTVSCLVGMMVEWIGVHTGLLFGNYQYGSTLGIKLGGVPLIIGINWFLVTYGSAMMMKKINERVKLPGGIGVVWKKILWAIDAACIAVLFDWIMEPVAVQLNYWHWSGNGSIPLYNYLCWFIVSWLLQILFSFLPEKRINSFAIHLLLIQTMFFLILRTFL